MGVGGSPFFLGLKQLKRYKSIFGGKGFKSPFKNFRENIILHWLSEVPFVFE